MCDKYITVDERKKKKEEQRKRERRHDESRKDKYVDNEKTSKSRGKEKESVTGTSTKRNIQEILEQAREDSTCTEPVNKRSRHDADKARGDSTPVNKRSRHEEVKVTNLDEEDKVCVINLGDHDITCTSESMIHDYLL